jgi:hypothetical protein
MITKQNTGRNLMLKVYLAADHVSPALGMTLTVTLSKNGSAFAAAGATVTERTGGWYQVALSTTDTNTLGDLVVRATAASCDDAERFVQVATATPDDIPTAAAVAAAVWAYVLEGAYTATHFMRLMASVLFGKASGLGTTTVFFRDMSDSKNRIQANVDAVGNRSTQTHDVS